jgi:hypothetical protein
LLTMPPVRSRFSALSSFASGTEARLEEGALGIDALLHPGVLRCRAHGARGDSPGSGRR